MTRTHIAAALALAAAACGGLDTPDLSTGALAGRLVGAAPGAFAYPLGRPDLRVNVGADGRYAFDRLPAGSASLVLVDGTVAGEARARLVALSVSGGNRTAVPDQFGEYAAVDPALKMPLASRVYATARVRNGASVVTARFGVSGTHVADVATEAAPLDTVAVLWPVPAGRFDVAAALAGYRPGLAQDVPVPEAQSVEVEVDLDVDGGDDAPGCLATGCHDSHLDCDQDGFCYECAHDSDCGMGGRCDPEVHTCAAMAGGGAVDACAACDPAATDAPCGAMNVCLSTGGASGFCTRACSGNGDCPAGMECNGTGACVPPLGCAEYLATFGTSCLKDDACSDALKGGECRGRTSGDPKPGYCTAQCRSSADCPSALGFTCDGSQCVPPP